MLQLWAHRHCAAAGEAGVIIESRGRGGRSVGAGDLRGAIESQGSDPAGAGVIQTKLTAATDVEGTAAQ